LGVIDRRDRKIACLDCGQLVDPTHPLQQKMEREWEESEKRTKEISARREQIERAEKDRLAKERERVSELGKAGAILHAISAEPFRQSGIYQGKPYAAFRVTVTLDFPITSQVNEPPEFRKRWLNEFQEQPDYKQAIQTRDQFSATATEGNALEETLLTLEQEYKAALSRAGGDVAKTENKLSAARNKLSVIKSRLAILSDLASKAEAIAREKYVAFVAERKQAALADVENDFGRLAFGWIGKANVGVLLQLLALKQAFQSLETAQPAFLQIAAGR
jgi:hypothetical protein